MDPPSEGGFFIVGKLGTRGRRFTKNGNTDSIYENRTRRGLELLHIDSRFIVGLKVCAAAPLSGRVAGRLLERIVACRSLPVDR